MTKKLIIVADSKHAKFYKAIGLKLKEAIGMLHAQSLKAPHKRQELRTGFYHKASTSSHFFDPHTEARNIERHEFCKEAINHLHTLYHQESYHEIIVVAEPKMLGEIRNNLSPELKKVISKEISKDLVHAKHHEIEELVFKQA